MAFFLIYFLHNAPTFLETGFTLNDPFRNHEMNKLILIDRLVAPDAVTVDQSNN